MTSFQKPCEQEENGVKQLMGWEKMIAWKLYIMYLLIRRTDAEVESLIWWLPDAKSWQYKDPDAGKDWRQEENGMSEDEMVE